MLWDILLRYTENLRPPKILLVDRAVDIRSAGLSSDRSTVDFPSIFQLLNHVSFWPRYFFQHALLQISRYLPLDPGNLIQRSSDKCMVSSYDQLCTTKKSASTNAVVSREPDLFTWWRNPCGLGKRSVLGWLNSTVSLDMSVLCCYDKFIS